MYVYRRACACPFCRRPVRIQPSRSFGESVRVVVQAECHGSTGITGSRGIMVMCQDLIVTACICVVYLCFVFMLFLVWCMHVVYLL